MACSVPGYLCRPDEQGQQTDLQELYQNFYQNERFVDVMPANSSPETRSVRGANELRIALYRP